MNDTPMPGSFQDYAELVGQEVAQREEAIFTVSTGISQLLATSTDPASRGFLKAMQANLNDFEQQSEVL